MASVVSQHVLSSIKTGLPPQCSSLLDERDGAFRLIKVLERSIDPSETPKGQCAVWDNCARYYALQGRFHEALFIYMAMYTKLLDMQEAQGERKHKGTPLIRISEMHGFMGHPLLAKRYLMLTLCEDAISSRGKISIDNTGSYFQGVWIHGMSDQEFHQYAADAWKACEQDSEASRFPEWALQELDQKWMTEYPSSAEASIYVGNRVYCTWLLSKLGAGDGKALERLAHYLLNCIPGFRAKMRMRTPATDYDVYCAVEGPTYDFRSGLGRYFLCESKDWKVPADVTTVNKFAQVLRGAKCEFGIIFSKKGISGQGTGRYAEREVLKMGGQGTTILTISESELMEVANGSNFFSMLRDLYERQHLDLQSKPQKRRKKELGKHH